MPELPEVETIKNDLRPYIVGQIFSDVHFDWPGVVRTPAPEEFYQRLRGQRVEDLSRRGKYLIFSLSGGDVLIIHLKMTGSLLLRSADASPDPYTRAVFSLDDGHQLRFIDPRKLGKMWLIEDERCVVGKLGPEPLDPAFTSRVLAERLARRSAPIKALLLDQGFLAGVGNIYADEALFEAKIHPLRSAKSLSKLEATELYRALILVLRRAVHLRGTTFSNYQDPQGRPGGHQLQLQVFRRTGQPCLACSTPIERLSLRGRGTHFCPSCQC